jgi:hypothetical protein
MKKITGIQQSADGNKMPAMRRPRLLAVIAKENLPFNMINKKYLYYPQDGNL